MAKHEQQILPNGRQNRLQQLRGFCYAAQAGSISRAAERLGLSQPSVSLQIQALERELKEVLFERRGPTIRLTPEGEILLEMARPLVDGMDALPASFAGRLGTLGTGELDIAAGESTLLYLLPEYVADFQQNYPDIQFKLHNVTGRDGMALLRADEVDFAVGSLLDVPDDMHYQPVFSFDPMLITPPDHPLAKMTDLSLEAISHYGLILPPQHLSTWRAVRMVFEQHKLELRVQLEAGGWEVIKKYVTLGAGISIVTAICLTGEENLHTQSLARWFPRRSYGIVTRRGKFLSPPAKAFIKTLTPEFYGGWGKAHDVKVNLL
ncbi:MAG TPA: LysR family transcriptional regulator [Gammaproteobacteria bacterium]|nr:LysR family transcriptional regulator [Gammaproteobacteria bacterium]